MQKTTKPKPWRHSLTPHQLVQQRTLCFKPHRSALRRCSGSMQALFKLREHSLEPRLQLIIQHAPTLKLPSHSTHMVEDPGYIFPLQGRIKSKRTLKITWKLREYRHFKIFSLRFRGWDEKRSAREAQTIPESPRHRQRRQGSNDSSDQSCGSRQDPKPLNPYTLDSLSGMILHLSLSSKWVGPGQDDIMEQGTS